MRLLTRERGLLMDTQSWVYYCNITQPFHTVSTCPIFIKESVTSSADCPPFRESVGLHRISSYCYCLPPDLKPGLKVRTRGHCAEKHYIFLHPPSEGSNDSTTDRLVYHSTRDLLKQPCTARLCDLRFARIFRASRMTRSPARRDGKRPR